MPSLAGDEAVVADVSWGGVRHHGEVAAELIRGWQARAIFRSLQRI